MRPLLQGSMSLSGGIGRQHHILQSRDPLDEIELLEDETEGLPPDFGQKPSPEGS